MASEKREYEFTEDGFFLGTHYKAGARAWFHPAQVRFDLHRMKAVADTAPAPRSSGRKGKGGE